MSKSNSLTTAVLRWPVVWGGLASLGFYTMLENGVVQSEFVHRYAVSHPVSYVAVTMFFVGLAALLAKGCEVAVQFGGLNQLSLGEVPNGGQPVAGARGLSEQLAQCPRHLRGGYMFTRLCDALDYVRRKGSADELDEHLRYAADVDMGRMQSSYSLVRIIIWAIPILGFLGTVVGITLAIAKLGPQDLDNSLPQVVDGLKVAFDTTALALSLSIVLMFAQFVVDRFETRLLSRVDDRVAEELVGRFQQFGSGTDPQAASVRRMADEVVQACGRLVERQVELWRTSLDTAANRWNQSAVAAGQQMEKAISGALTTGLEQHAKVLTQSELASAEQNRAHWTQLQQTLNKTSEAIARQHAETARQGEVLSKAIQASGEVQKLEHTLNKNLATLSGVHNFEETVLSLSAAIQLLTKQLHTTGGSHEPVQLRRTTAAPSAA